MPRVPKITSLNYLLQDLKKDQRDGVDFLPADKHQSFLEVNTILFDSMLITYLTSLQYLYNISEKKVRQQQFGSHTHILSKLHFGQACAQCAYADAFKC